MMWFTDLMDDVVHLMDLQRLWRIYVGVALTFLVMIMGTGFFSQEKTACFFMAVVLLVGIVGSVFWHKSAADDDQD